jgi:hypothetical protein
MKKIYCLLEKMCFWFKYAWMPTNMLLRQVNRPDLVGSEAYVVGGILLRKFKTDEELEEKCEELFGFMN